MTCALFALAGVFVGGALGAVFMGLCCANGRDVELDVNRHD